VKLGLAPAAVGSASSGAFPAVRSAAQSNFSGFSGAPHAGKGVLGKSTCHSCFKSASGLQGRLAMAQI
jgi:hypothetical protein